MAHVPPHLARMAGSARPAYPARRPPELPAGAETVKPAEPAAVRGPTRIARSLARRITRLARTLTGLAVVR